MRPGANGTVTSCPAFFAACSTAAHPPRTIRSASETFLPPDCAPLKSCWICSRVRSTCASSAGLLTSQSFCGARRIRAPLAPPRLSVPRKLAADAQAVETSWEMDSPEARILPLRAAMSSPRSARDRPRGRGPATAAAPEPTGRGSARRAPCRGAAACTTPWRTRRRAGPDSRGSASRSARRSGPSSAHRSVVSIIGACRFDGSCASGTVPWASGFLGVHCFAPAGLVVSSHSYLNRLSRNPLSHFVGSLVHAPSSPLVIVSAPLPLPKRVLPAEALLLEGRALGFRADVLRHWLRHGPCRRCGRRR